MYLKHKNTVYRWVGKLYLIPDNSGEVYLIKSKPPLEHLPLVSTSTIKYYGEVVGKDFTFK